MNDIIENKKKSEVLAEEIAKLDYGTVILHSQIATIIQESYGTHKYNTVIQSAKKLLLKKYGKVIHCIKGNGYRIIQPDDYTDHALKEYKRGFKSIQKGTDTLTYAPVKDMTEEGKTTYRAVYDRANRLNAAMIGAKAELKALNTKKHPFMLENIKN